jgi:hypothetical protein
MVAELLGEFSYLGMVAVEQTMRYRSFCANSLERSIVHGVLRKGWTLIDLYFIIQKPMFLFKMSLQLLHISLAAQIKQQKAGKFNAFGVSNKLTRKVYPDPVRIFFVGFPYRVSNAHGSMKLSFKVHSFASLL